MKTGLGVLRGVSALMAALGCQPGQKSSVETPVERGRYLVTARGCNDCHTPWKLGAKGPAPDMSRMLSGHPEGIGRIAGPQADFGPWGVQGTLTMTAWAGPWGVSYAANLTPDGETGIGAWDANVFIQAMRTGKHMGAGRPILPPMPWSWYGKLSDQDLEAIFAYLQSIPPVNNEVPDPLPPPAPPGG